MNVSAVVGLLGIGVVVGDVVDFAIEKFKAKDVAAELWYKASVGKWDNDWIAAAFKFSDQYLTRVFGVKRFSFRTVGICVLVAFLTTEVANKATELDFDVKNIYFALYVVLSGIVDAVALFFSRSFISWAIGGLAKKRTRFMRALFSMSLIAYVAIAYQIDDMLQDIKRAHPNEINFGFPIVLFAILWPVIFSVVPWLRIFLTLLIPPAFTTLLLLITLFVPFVIVKTRRITKPLGVAILDGLGEMPPWTGRAIGLLCSGVIAVLNLHKS